MKILRDVFAIYYLSSGDLPFFKILHDLFQLQVRCYYEMMRLHFSVTSLERIMASTVNEFSLVIY